MRLHPNIFSVFSTATLCAPVWVQTSPINGSLARSESLSGEVATEIDPRIWVLHQSRNGDYWFGSNGNGAYRYDGHQVTHYSQEDGLPGHQVRDIVDDPRGGVLISTYSGVARFDGKTFVTLEIVEPPHDPNRWQLDEDDVWLVYRPGHYGPCRYDGEKIYHLELSKSPAEDAFLEEFGRPGLGTGGVYSIYEDRRGHLWFGTASVGLCRFDGESLSWMYEERLTTTPNGGAFGIRSIYEDRAGDFWITNTRQRFEIASEAKGEDGFSILQYEKKKGLPRAASDTDENFTYYPSMTEDEAGKLWMACGDDGVWSYDGETVKRYAIGQEAYALAILCDQAGKLWVGTVDQGIYTLESTGFERFRPSGTTR